MPSSSQQPSSSPNATAPGTKATPSRRGQRGSLLNGHDPKLSSKPVIPSTTSEGDHSTLEDIAPHELDKLRAVRELMQLKGEAAIMKFLQS